MFSRKLYRPRLVAALFSAVCLLAHARAQNPTQPAPRPPAKDDEEVVRISTELVQTDVMVFDGQGRFVDGLKPEQFELRVDGKPQPLSFFERVKAGTVDEDAQLAAARGGASRGASPGGAALPLDRGRTVVFFVDDLHLSASSNLQIRKTLLRFIEEEIGQNDEAAVVSASGQVGFLQQLTDNKAVLRAAAERINPRTYSTQDGQTPPMTETHAVAVERGDADVLAYFVDYLLRDNPFMKRDTAESLVEARARGIIQQSSAIAANTLHSLASVVRSVAPLPGRKVLFFISDGFIVDDGDKALRDRMRLISDAAARAGVVIYALDAQGLRTGQPDASMAVAPDSAGRLNRVHAGEAAAMQAPLFTLAADTGGRALVNTNALGRVVSGALKETSLYYLLAWRPDSPQGGGAPKYQRIEVSVSGRPDLRVMVRRGFYNAAPPEPAPRAEKKKKDEGKPEGVVEPEGGAARRDLLAALRAPLPRAGLPTSLAVGYVYGEKDVSVIAVSLELDQAALTFEKGEKLRADVDLLGTVVDASGKTVSQFGNRLTVTPDTAAAPDPAAAPTRRAVMYSFSVPLPAGLYQVRAAARDERSGRTGSAMQWVEVPELKKQFAMSSIFVGERTGEAKAEDAPRTMMLKADRRFARTSHLRFLTYLYNAAAGAEAQPDVALQVQVFRDDQPVFTAPLSKLRVEQASDFSRLPYMAELSLGAFPAGRYVLQVTAIDRAAKASASRRANFVVE